jgi:hypothetical protein
MVSYNRAEIAPKRTTIKKPDNGNSKIKLKLSQQGMPICPRAKNIFRNSSPRKSKNVTSTLPSTRPKTIAFQKCHKDWIHNSRLKKGPEWKQIESRAWDRFKTETETISILFNGKEWTAQEAISRIQPRVQVGVKADDQQRCWAFTKTRVWQSSSRRTAQSDGKPIHRPVQKN